MLFIPTLSKKQFESFIALNNGENPDILPPDKAVACGTRFYGVRYVGLQDDSGELSAVMLLFEYKPPRLPGFYYGCKWHVLEHNKDLMTSEFIKALKTFARDNKAMFVFQVPGADSVIKPIVVDRAGWFFYEKALPFFRRLKSLFKNNRSETGIASSVSDMP